MPPESSRSLQRGDSSSISHVDFHEGTLRLRGATRDIIQNQLAGIPLRLDSRDACYRCDAMWAAQLRIQLPEPVEWRVDEFIDSFDNLKMTDRRKIRLRADQLEAVADFESGNRRGLLVLPTGTGKTVIAIELILRHGASVLVVVPVRDLMYQWHDKIREATGIDAGLIGDGVHRVSPISVTTYDSAAIHMPRIGNRFSMIVFDEVHHLAGRWRSDAARMSIAPIRLGLTATPPTDTDRLAVLGECVGPILHQQSIANAAGKTLAEYVIRRIAVRLTPDESDRYRQLSKIVQEFVYHQRQLDDSFRWEDVHKITAAAETDPQRSAEALQAVQAFRAKRKIEEQADAKMRTLEDLFRLHAGHPVIVFTGSNVMARKISMRFMVPCLLSHCAKKERREYLAGFAAGQYPVLVANRVLDEGVDLPEVKTAIVLGGLSSGRQAIQRLGRVLRKGDGSRATLYEVVVEDTGEVQRSRARRRNDTYRR
ncbi:DEAD/DEAH box helicase [Rubripirellula lacrimiformis]|uniref:DEAD/DEAH box helicase n=1 Tax=Rubripirellula lacrimiformis TaxID=1930273 RepID=UPI001C54ECA6|nr:DEAD/DEAH box helicase [Rubripirellula lacrimiformis]